MPDWFYQYPLSEDDFQKLCKGELVLKNFYPPLQPVLFVSGKDWQVAEGLSVILGSHGLGHLYYARISRKDLLGVNQTIQLCTGLSEWFRFPYLDWNWKLLQTASKYFRYESSVVSRRMLPFKIGVMLECPITPPTDTYFRAFHSSSIVLIADLYRNLIAEARGRNRTVTLLLHPNKFSVSVLRELHKK